MTVNVSYSWPCRVTRESNGRYLITPYAAMECARDGASLYAASLSAGDALHSHIKPAARSGDFLEAPAIDVRPKELRAGRVIKVLVEG